MKYLYDDTDYLNDNKQVKEQKHAELKNRFEIYSVKFGEIKDRFPKRFLSLYETEGLHDFQLKEIRFISKGKHYDVIIQIAYFDELYEITYEQVDTFRTDFNGFNEATIIYNEFLDAENGLLSNEYYLVNGKPGSIFLTFKKMKFKIKTGNGSLS